ncbi:MAG: histone [Candidatus Nanohaloarchaea archaeon]|nr:histone [Candidatus Nanohaloarchaea archaeon]
MDFPRAPVERIMRKAGADRISQGAVEALRKSVEELAEEIAQDSVEISREGGNRKVDREDVKAACE